MSIEPRGASSICAMSVKKKDRERKCGLAVYRSHYRGSVSKLPLSFLILCVFVSLNLTLSGSWSSALISLSKSDARILEFAFRLVSGLWRDHGGDLVLTTGNRQRKKTHQK